MHRPRVILDAQLLVLLVVGLYDRSLLGRHKRLKAYAPEDFDLLVEVLERAEKIVVTPNTLTEASNLLKHAGNSELSEQFGIVIKGALEVLVESPPLADDELFPRLGLTDVALLTLPSERSFLLTADWELHNCALEKGLASENFNHLRAERGIV